MRLLALIIYILAELQPDGSAVITETWDIDATKGTELYLVRENLGDIEIRDFSVSEDGITFINEGAWDTERSIGQKAGRCGIVRKRNGCELCWGLGNYGHHLFTARYTMSNAVKSLNDYDKLHLQFVSPGITPSPDHVKVEIKAPVALGPDNTRIWGFGFEGTSGFGNDGSVIFESTTALRSGWSVIGLLRFDKGIFNSPSVRDTNFDDDLEQALEGASFSDDKEEESIWEILVPLITFISFILASVGIAKTVERRNRRKILGCDVKDIQWFRDIPCNGDVLQANYILGRLGENGKDTIASALILKMVNDGRILVSNDAKGNIEMSFNPYASVDGMSESEQKLYQMMKEASGKDIILQKNEFKRWATRHTSRIYGWSASVTSEGKTRLAAADAVKGSRFTEEGQRTARELLGFRKYLTDFTLLDERYTKEVSLWHDLLIFAALFGIAEKVAKELQEINPKAFEETFQGGYETTNQTIMLTRMMANSITNARVAHGSGSSRSGLGGYTSIGGGGGFSGGGFGGGVR